MTSNLTRDEARERAGHIMVESYQVELDLTGPGPDLRVGHHDPVQFGPAGRMRPSLS